jgi:hypothetical protein
LEKTSAPGRSAAPHTGHVAGVAPAAPPLLATAGALVAAAGVRSIGEPQSGQ